MVKPQCSQRNEPKVLVTCTGDGVIDGRTAGGLDQGPLKATSVRAGRGRSGTGRCQLPPPGRSPLGAAVARRWQYRQVHDCGRRRVLVLLTGSVPAARTAQPAAVYPLGTATATSPLNSARDASERPTTRTQRGRCPWLTTTPGM